MRVFHVQGDQFTELPALPEAAPDAGYVWIGIARAEFEVQNASVQAALQRWTGSQLVDLFSYTCPHGTCPRQIHGVVFRPDGLHYEGRSASIVSEWIMSQVPGAGSPGG